MYFILRAIFLHSESNRKKPPKTKARPRTHGKPLNLENNQCKPTCRAYRVNNIRANTPPPKDKPIPNLATEQMSMRAHSGNLSKSAATQPRTYSAWCMNAQGSRPYMEDTYLRSRLENLGPGWRLYGIFDGHGGASVAGWLSENVASLVQAAIQNEFEKSALDLAVYYRLDQEQRRTRETVPITRALESAVAQAETQLFAEWLNRQVRQKHTSSAGSTLLLALFSPSSMLYLANVGDSRGILYDVTQQPARMLQQTVDHSVNRSRSERVRIEAAGGWISSPMSFNDVPRLNGILAVARSLGDFAPGIKVSTTESTRLLDDPPLSARPDIYVQPLAPDHQYLLLMGTDGLWDAFPGQKGLEEVRSIVGESSTLPPVELVQMLNDKALSKFASSDNVTVLSVST